MLEIIIWFAIIYWIVNEFLTSDKFFAGLITVGIMFVFTNIDFEKETIKPKKQEEINQTLDEIHNGTLNIIEKVGEITGDGEKAFTRGQEKVKNHISDPTKLDIDSFEFPAPAHLRISILSNAAASLYKDGDDIYACTKNDECFKNFIVKTHYDNTRYICRSDERCYRAE